MFEKEEKVRINNREKNKNDYQEDLYQAINTGEIVTICEKVKLDNDEWIYNVQLSNDHVYCGFIESDLMKIK